MILKRAEVRPRGVVVSNPKSPERRIAALEQQVTDLAHAVRLLATNCSCTVAERMSGHLVDCAVPHVADALGDNDGDDGEAA